MTKKLFGLNVIITRPQPRSGGLQRLVMEQGGNPILFPVLDIEKIADSEIQLVVDQLSNYEICIFMSQHAVLNFMLSGLGKQIVAAMGSATANALAKFNVRVDLTPAQYDSEHLFALLKSRPLKNKNILIVSGEGGRTYLEEALREEGAKVTKLAVYRRVRPPVNPVLLAQLKLEIERFPRSIIIVTSCESFDNLEILCEQYGLGAFLSAKKILTNSERISQHITAKGWDLGQLLIAENGSDQAILDRLMRWYSQQLQLEGGVPFSS